jgi:hypothetical protein
MKSVRGICLVGLTALGGWSIACSIDDIGNARDRGGNEQGSGGSPGAGGAGSGGTAGSAGKAAGTGGNPKQGGGGAGKAGAAGSAGGTEPDAGEPSIVITAPADLSAVGAGPSAPDFPKVPISFKVGHFELMTAGTPVRTCPLGACGHVHINVDGKDCDDVASGAPYNVQGIASPLDIDLDHCKQGVVGAHTVTASLHNTDHSVVENGAGDTIEYSITIAVRSASAEGGAPEGGAAKPDAGDGG